MPPSNTAKAPKSPAAAKTVEALKHSEAKRKNIPTAEYEPVLKHADQAPIRIAYERRNRDLDPQLVWRGKEDQDWTDLVIQAPPLYIQEKVHPKALIDDLLRSTKERQHEAGQLTADLFSDFNGIPKGVDKTEFYQHDQNWSNRMILGDSLQVMASLAEREGLRGKVQCIYFDPPYGIKFNSNFQWSTTSRDVKDGKIDQITREPEQVKAFRDTWRDGVHSYLTYLRDRLLLARDLLTESGSIFLQISDENVHHVRELLDETFGSNNFCALISFRKTSGASSPFARTNVIGAVADFLLWFAKDLARVKYRQLYVEQPWEPGSPYRMLEVDGRRRAMTRDEAAGDSAPPRGSRVFTNGELTSQGIIPSCIYPVRHEGKEYVPSKGRHWATTPDGMRRLQQAARLGVSGDTLRYVRFKDDFGYSPINTWWEDTGTGSFTDPKVYVVQTGLKVVQRCLLMASDPGDLVLDPTCGSGTTAFVAEQWGRRWITIDTSRVALALARARIMGARYPFYLLSDSREGQLKEAELKQSVPSTQPTFGNIRQGFVYERVPHVTLKSLANNAEIDVIWEKWQETLVALRTQLNAGLKQKWEEWEISWDAESSWPEASKQLHARWWEARIARQKEIDGSIAAKAEFENLYDRAFEDRKKVRVAGPFTVESLSPHRVLGVDENDELIDPLAQTTDEQVETQSFPQMILENLRTAGVQQAHKSDKIAFTSLTPWPGTWVCGEGRYLEKDISRRAAIFIGPEFGTVQRADLVEAAREAADGGFDVLIACAFNYEAHTTDFDKLGRIPVLKARMNAELHMSADLKNTGKGNLFVVFGEPDIDVLPQKDGRFRVKVKGVDVFEPGTGEVRSDGPDGIACWFIDTDYNAESFFVRHAYFLGANDPYSALKTTLKAEVDKDAWESLHSDTSRPFPKPKSGRIAVKVINHLGDEVMKVFKVGA